jgi:hypothetical protein
MVLILITMPADPLQFSAPVTPVDVLDKATEEGDLSEIAFRLPDPSNVHDQGIDELPAHSIDDENPFHNLPDNYPLTQVEPPAGSTEDKIPFHNLPDTRALIPIEPPAGNVEDENPFQQLNDTRPLTPTPDLHLRDDNSGPSEPIALALSIKVWAVPWIRIPKVLPWARLERRLIPNAPPRRLLLLSGMCPSIQIYCNSHQRDPHCR